MREIAISKNCQLDVNLVLINLTYKSVKLDTSLSMNILDLTIT